MIPAKKFIPQLPLVEISHISKRFGPVQANNDISLQFKKGRIKALLGENGAGKSTLMSILAGNLQPDSGAILVEGSVRQFRSPRDAHAAGIGMVYQHFKLVENLTVAENVLLGQDGGFFISPSSMQQHVAEIAGKYAITLDPAARVESLSMGEKQLVEILKLLYRDSNLLIFDEPTAVLTPPETEYLFKSLRHMALRGKSIIFISHKLGEVLEIADEIALLRLGQVIDEFDVVDAPPKELLAERMMGHSVDLQFSVEPVPAQEVVLEASNVETSFGKDVSFALRKGEILAIVGVAGNGQGPLVSRLTGASQAPGGAVSLLGQDSRVFFSSPPQMHGFSYIPEDRQGVGVCLHMSLTDNVLLTARELFTEGWTLSRSKALAATKEIIAQYNVRPGDPAALARSLSGGNLQKLVIGRELLRKPQIILAENPTQGLDVAATEDVWRRLAEARQFAGILLITGDIAEALQLADRIAVIYRGQFVDSFSVNQADKVASIGGMMAGVVAG